MCYNKRISSNGCNKIKIKEMEIIISSNGCNKIKIKEMEIMAKWVCNICGYIYDPEVGDPDNGVAAGTAWEDVPEDWVCPLCGVGKDQFSEQ